MIVKLYLADYPRGMYIEQRRAKPEKVVLYKKFLNVLVVAYTSLSVVGWFEVLKVMLTEFLFVTHICGL